VEDQSGLSVEGAKIFAQDYEDSRFGIFGAYALEYYWFMEHMEFDDSDYWNWVDGHFENLGAHWTRSNTQLIWELIEPELNGNYVWDILTNPDSVITNIYDSHAGVNWLGCFNVGREEEFRNPLDYPDNWQNFLMAAVDRYNGDGINDLNGFVNVKYWQIGNEIPCLQSAGLSPEDYAEIVALSESAIHSIDPEAKICLVAPTNGFQVELYLQLSIQELAILGIPIDVIDIHHWRNAGNYKIQAISEYRDILDSNGYENVEIWSCEHGTWCYQPDNQPFQTKSEQAESLVKRYLWNFANGMDKLFWNNLMEWHGFAGNPGSVFNSMGLIGDGSFCGEPPDEFNHIRKNYYSYKILAENIDSHKAEFIGENDFHDEANGNYGYTYCDLETGNYIQFVWTELDSAVYSFSIDDEYEWTNLIPIDDDGNFETLFLQPGTYSITILAGDVFLLKKEGQSSTEEGTTGPASARLNQNFPNPFQSVTTVSYSLQCSGNVSVAIFDIAGRRICTLVDAIQPDGNHSVVWDGRDNRGYQVSSGIYFCRLDTGEVSLTNTMLLL
jgi:cellobiose-specific phosphotransferase system component IIB